MSVLIVDGLWTHSSKILGRDERARIAHNVLGQRQSNTVNTGLGRRRRHHRHRRVHVLGRQLGTYDLALDDILQVLLDVSWGGRDQVVGWKSYAVLYHPRHGQLGLLGAEAIVHRLERVAIEAQRHGVEIDRVHDGGLVQKQPDLCLVHGRFGDLVFSR